MSLMENFSILEKRIGYEFKDKKLLETALTHSSFANERGGAGTESFERLEFLGDAVTGLEVARLIFEKGDRLTEGRMTSARAALVSSAALARVARSLGLGEYLRLGVGAERTGVRENDTILEDAFEALAAAVFLDGGHEAARAFIRGIFEKPVDALVHGSRSDARSGINADYKSHLQTELQKNGEVEIKYVTIGESGPDHNKTFNVGVEVHGRRLGTGTGKTKKDAEKMAAKMALEELLCI